MAELDFLYMGIGFGLIPALFIVIRMWGPISDSLHIFFYGRKAVRVAIIKKNRQIDTGVAKFDGSTIMYHGERRPFASEEIGLAGRTPLMIFYEDGQQIKMSENNVVYPLTAKEFDTAVVNAMIATKDSYIVKEVRSMKLLVLGALAAAAASAFFGYSLVEKLLK